MFCIVSMCRRPERDEDYTVVLPSLPCLHKAGKRICFTHNCTKTSAGARCMDWPQGPPVPWCLPCGRAASPSRAARACTPSVGARGPRSPPRVRKAGRRASAPLCVWCAVNCCKLPRHTPVPDRATRALHALAGFFVIFLSKFDKYCSFNFGEEIISELLPSSPYFSAFYIISVFFQFNFPSSHPNACVFLFPT
jgi:hypothetical protein